MDLPESPVFLSALAANGNLISGWEDNPGNVMGSSFLKHTFDPDFDSCHNKG